MKNKGHIASAIKVLYIKLNTGIDLQAGRLGFIRSKSRPPCCDFERTPAALVIRPLIYPRCLTTSLGTMRTTAVLALASAALAAPSNTKSRRHAANHLGVRGNSSAAGTKIILDNDWSTAGFVPYLMALDAGWNVLGLVGDTGDSWALQTSLHGLATLEVGNLSSCIPVYKGSDYPLVNTPELFHVWEDLHGDLPWVRIPHSYFTTAPPPHPPQKMEKMTR